MLCCILLLDKFLIKSVDKALHAFKICYCLKIGLRFCGFILCNLKWCFLFTFSPLIAFFQVEIGLPYPQRVVQLPEISWDQYTTSLGNFEREFRNRKRNSRRAKLIFDKGKSVLVKYSSCDSGGPQFKPHFCHKRTRLSTLAKYLYITEKEKVVSEGHRYSL